MAAEKIPRQSMPEQAPEDRGHGERPRSNNAAA